MITDKQMDTVKDPNPKLDKCRRTTEPGLLRLNTNGSFIPESQSVCKLQVRLTILVSCSFSERLHFQFVF